jgi:hypothetical protein
MKFLYCEVLCVMKAALKIYNSEILELCTEGKLRTGNYSLSFLPSLCFNLVSKVVSHVAVLPCWSNVLSFDLFFTG